LTHEDLARSYLKKIEVRLKVLPLFLEEKDYSDVVREAQEIVELALKGILRKFTIDPPKIHDVSKILLEYKYRFSVEEFNLLDSILEDSKWLRKERELSMYGDIDFIPTEEYDEKEAMRALHAATVSVTLSKKIIEA